MQCLIIVLLYDLQFTAVRFKLHMFFLTQSSNRQDLLEGVSLSIPIFHCYGHKASCQVKCIADFIGQS